MSPEEMLRAAGITWKRSGRANEVRFPCPFCSKSDGFDLNIKSGLWQCKRASCGEKGGLYKLKVQLGMAYNLRSADKDELGKGLERTEEEIAKWREECGEAEKLYRYLLTSKLAESARDYLERRGFSQKLWAEARLGWYPRMPGKGRKGKVNGNGAVGIPTFTGGNGQKASTVKLRWVPPEPAKDGRPWRYARIGDSHAPLYAPLGVDQSKTILLVGGELDALSCYEALIRADLSKDDIASSISWIPVSSPDGEGSWPDHLSEEVAEAEDIVICFDSDPAGEKGAKKVASALGAWRCRRGTWPGQGKDANAALIEGDLTMESIAKLIRDAKPMAGTEVIKSKVLIDDAIARIFTENKSGWGTGIHTLTALIGGWRPGEVTVISGHSGCGKTTWAVQHMLHQILNGKPGGRRKAFAVALEGGPVWLLAKKVSRYLCGRNPYDAGEEEVRAELTNIGDDLILLNHEGFVEIEPFIETLRYVVTRLGVEWVMIDHLSFATKRDKFRWQNQNELLRGIQTVIQNSDAHCHLLAHPSKIANTGQKTRDDAIVQMSDLKGESEVFQDVANFISIYRPRTESRDNSKHIDQATGHYKAMAVVGKQRDEAGSEGAVELLFDKEASRFYPGSVNP